MKPFIQVDHDEQFLTYASNIEDARVAFVAEGLPADGRVREQPPRKASAFVYTSPDGGNTKAVVVGEVPAEFRDDDDPGDTIVDGDLHE